MSEEQKYEEGFELIERASVKLEGSIQRLDDALAEMSETFSSLRRSGDLLSEALSKMTASTNSELSAVTKMVDDLANLSSIATGVDLGAQVISNRKKVKNAKHVEKKDGGDNGDSSDSVKATAKHAKEAEKEVDRLGKTAKRTGRNMVGSFDLSRMAMMGMFSMMDTYQAEGKGGFAASLQASFEEMAANLPGMVEAFGQALMGAGPALLEAGKSLFATIVQALRDNFGPLMEKAGALLRELVAYLPTFIPMLLTAAGTLFVSIAQAVPGVLVSLQAAMEDLLYKAVKFVADKGSDMMQAGKDLIDGLVNGVKNAAGRVADAIGGVINSAIDWAKSLLGIHSPSTVFKGIGGNLSQGFADGIASKAAVAAGAMKDLVDDVVAEGSMKNLSLSREFAAGMVGGLRSSMAFGLASSTSSGMVGSVNNYYIDGVDLSSNATAGQPVVTGGTLNMVDDGWVEGSWNTTGLQFNAA